MQWGIVISGVVMLALPACATAADNKAPLVTAVAAKVVSVYDGDTIKVDAQPWPDETHRTNVRVRGIDTPEIGQAKCDGEKAAALIARDRMAELAGKEIRLDNVEFGKYAKRVVADVTPCKRSADGVLTCTGNAGQVLIDEGLARPYDGGKRQGWCSE